MLSFVLDQNLGLPAGDSRRSSLLVVRRDDLDQLPGGM
jgi:hypothetical protein